ncbi:TetR/AcrR family transcriptional regulator [Brachybacterium sp. ACRRE]|uniref:TetR/AcrR family transcriptional regulator n=1 Tax=Brachybacterium sp. ACRRE TaxID=2918184 RepID=UPI001EF39ED7|nr:TetR family transcriptional regulator [Brachybacterium sp. ACRRE]MCG7309214.1 TetR family transcriptional regulator [Brachybacterium sp. ACRRE]
MGTTSDRQTADRLITAALRMFGEHGYDGAGVRAITEEAGANIAAVKYHFGSKQGLFRAVIGLAMERINTQRERRLDEMFAGGRPTAAELVDAFVSAALVLAERGSIYDADLARFLGRVVCDPDPRLRRAFSSEVASVEGRYLDELVRALPGLRRCDVEFRFRSMVGLLALHQIGSLRQLAPGPVAATVEQDSDALRVLALQLFQVGPQRAGKKSMRAGG